VRPLGGTLRILIMEMFDSQAELIGMAADFVDATNAYDWIGINLPLFR
jgi:hypothetical protein